MDSVTAGAVSPGQRRRLEARFGSGARDWIEDLPGTLDRLCGQWDLEIEGVHRPGRTSVVYACRRKDGRRGALKVSPEARLVSAESRMLGLWSQTGRVPQVWEVDSDLGAMLMESVEPGGVLADTDGPPDLERIAALIRDLHRAELTESQLAQLRPLTSWARFFFDDWERRRVEGPAADVVSASLMHRGYCRARELTSHTEYDVALHAQLHRENVLEGGPERGLVAIDPAGCLGDPVFDAVHWVLWRAESRAEVDRRVAHLAELLDLDEERLARAAAALAPVQAVASVTNDTVTQAALDTLLDLADT
jgi:streptomycin 6-kinase